MQNGTDPSLHSELFDAPEAPGSTDSSSAAGQKVVGSASPDKASAAKADARAARLAAALKANIGRRKAAGRIIASDKTEK